MDRWRGKVAVVTGASAGIGLAIAKTLVQEGLTVVGLARRKDKMLKEMKAVNGPGKFYAKECDVAKEKDVDEAFSYVKKTFKTVNILVNNAGIFVMKSVEEADIKEMQDVVNVNLLGLLYCTKHAIKLMKENNEEAYIININSVGGHKVPTFTFPNGVKLNVNIYSPTKFAVTSLSEVLTNELLGSKIHVTSLSPGYVQTDIVSLDANEEFISAINKIPFLHPEDVANAVVYIVGNPHHVHIAELTIKPHGELS